MSRNSAATTRTTSSPRFPSPAPRARCFWWHRCVAHAARDVAGTDHYGIEPLTRLLTGGHPLHGRAPRERSFAALDNRKSGETVKSRRRLRNVAAISLAAATPALAQIATVGPNVDINRQSGYQAEES